MRRGSAVRPVLLALAGAVAGLFFLASPVQAGPPWDPCEGNPDPCCSAPCSDACTTYSAKCQAGCSGIDPDCCTDPCGAACSSTTAKCQAGCPGVDFDCCIDPCGSACSSYGAKCEAGCSGTNPICCIDPCSPLCDSHQAKCEAGCEGIDQDCCEDPCGSACSSYGAKCEAGCAGTDPDCCEDPCGSACASSQAKCEAGCADVPPECCENPEEPCCSCSIGGGHAFVCPGGTAEAELTFSCFEECSETMSFTVLNAPEGVTVDIPAGVCSEGKVTFTVSAAEDVLPTSFMIDIEGQAGDGEPCTGTITVTVNRPDLTLQGLGEETEPEPHELAPGGLVPLNKDDDDTNGTADKDQAGPITGENDLVALSVDSSGATTGTLKLEAASGGSRVKIWETATKQNEIVLPKTWDLASETPPATVWVEGVVASAAPRDVELKLTYTAEGGSGCSDSVKLTVVGVDLVLQDLTEETTPEPHELKPGGFITLNDDDDNNNATPDVSETGAIAGEDNLAVLKLTVTPSGLDFGTLTLEAPAGGTSIKLWKSANRTQQETLPKSWTLPAATPPPAQYYVEGVTQSGALRNITIRATAAAHGANARDEVKATVFRVRLKEVTFSGTDYRAVTQDNGTVYPTPHWQDNSATLNGQATDVGDRRFPVAYLRNKPIRVTTAFQVEPAPDTATGYKMKGDGPGAVDIPETAATRAGNRVTITNITSSGNLENKIQFLKPMEIAWRVTLDDGKSWYGAKSDNRAYVLLATSTATRYESVLDVSCRRADGKDVVADAVTAIWGDFQGPVPGVLRKAMDGYNKADGVEMKYWNPPVGPCQNLPDMLKAANGNGSCAAWAQLFKATLDVQGITGAVVSQVRPDTTAVPGAAGFMVKDWKFDKHIRTGPNGLLNSLIVGDDRAECTAGGGFPDQGCVGVGGNGVLDTAAVGDDAVVGGGLSTGPNGVCQSTVAVDDVQILPVGQGEPDMPCIFPGPNGVLNSAKLGDDTDQDGLFPGMPFPYLRDYDAVEVPGIPGQGNSNPPEAFENHYVVKYGGKIYDPSYGAGPFNSEADHENAAIDGLLDAMDRARKATAARELTYTP